MSCISWIPLYLPTKPCSMFASFLIILWWCPVSLYATTCLRRRWFNLTFCWYLHIQCFAYPWFSLVLLVWVTSTFANWNPCYLIFIWPCRTQIWQCPTMILFMESGPITTRTIPSCTGTLLVMDRFGCSGGCRHSTIISNNVRNCFFLLSRIFGFLLTNGVLF